MRIIVAAALILSACQADRRYLGDTRPPAAQRLVFANYGEPATLDPALVSVVFDATIQQALFEGLAVNNPITSLPMAGIATHYRVSADGREYRFYLRGNPSPQGIRLDDIASLPAEFSHGARAPTDSIPARWTDGSVVTAADFVYAWQRVVDPRTASPSGSDLAVILNAPDIVAGKRSPDQLGVEAVDDFTLRVRLEAPAPYFLSLVAQCDFLPVRRDTVVGRERVVGNGPFVLREWRPYDQLRLAKNRDYYARDLVRLDEVTFVPLKDTAAVNLYRAGLVHDMSGYSLPYVLLPALQHNLDFRRDPQNSLFHVLMNVHDPPFDNKMVRWAVNMALDKRAIADFSFAEAAKRLVPGIPGYTPPGSVMVDVGGKKYDILAYDPSGARELLAVAGYPGGADSAGRRLSFPINTSTADLAEVIRQQLERNLNIEPRVNVMEFSVLWPAYLVHALPGFVLAVSTLSYPDPYGLLSSWFTDIVDWHDAAYVSELDEANGTLDPQSRMRKLARCEARLLEAMAAIPVCFMPNIYITKPYVRGMKRDITGDIYFRYAWIDTAWKP